MKTLELLEKLRSRPLFTINDLSRMLQKDEKYVKVVVYRLRKRGLIKHIERGKYTIHDDVIEFASNITTPSYVSFWTALMMHHLTEQLPIEIMIAVPVSKKEIIFKGTRIKFYKTTHFWGYEKKRLRDFDIFIADKEKTIIDCMILKNTPLDEIAKAIASDEIDYQRLINYTKKINSPSLTKRIGYLMERYHKDANELLGMIDNNIIPLDWSLKAKGINNLKWRLVVNKELDKI